MKSKVDNKSAIGYNTANVLVFMSLISPFKSLIASQTVNEFIVVPSFASNAVLIDLVI